MNKYQEALYRLEYCSNQISCYYCKFKDNCVETQKLVVLLQELVNKATPNKPIGNKVDYNSHYGKYDTTVYYCSRCNEYVTGDMNYCCNCGQAIDWEEK